MAQPAPKAPLELEDAWATIRRDGIEKTTHLLETAFEPGRPPLNQHETLALYNVVYDLTTRTGERNCSAELYRRHGDVLREYCRTSVLPKVQHLAGDFLLAALLQRWNRFYVFQRTMARIFQYLERYYCSDHKLPTLMEVAMTAFRRVVYDSIRHDVGDALVALLNAERCGEAVDGIVIKQAKDICTQIADGSTELWVTDVETAMVLATPHFYAERAMEWLATMSVPEYLHHVDAVLAAEMARAHAYLLPESATPLRQAAEMGLLERVQDRILEHPTSGLRQLLREGRKEDLVRLFRLLMRVQTGVACIARVARRYYCEEALQAVHAARGAASDDAFAGVEAAASSSASGRCCSASCADATMGGSCESATCSVWQPTSARSECTDGAASGEPQHWLLPDIPPRDALSPEALAALRDLHKRERAVIKSIFSGHHRLEEALRDVLAAPLALDAAAPAPVGRR